MPVFDFNASTDNKNLSECTYQIFRSNHGEATPEKPIMILDNKVREWKHHSSGMFTNPVKRTSFEFDEEEGKRLALNRLADKYTKSLNKHLENILNAIDESLYELANHLYKR